MSRIAAMKIAAALSLVIETAAPEIFAVSVNSARLVRTEPNRKHRGRRCDNPIVDDARRRRRATLDDGKAARHDFTAAASSSVELAAL